MRTAGTGPPKHTTCHCCGGIVTIAECLLELAREVEATRGQLLYVPVGCHDLDVKLARIKLAIDFQRRGPAFQLRAIVEEWDQPTLIREMY